MENDFFSMPGVVEMADGFAKSLKTFKKSAQPE